MENQIQKSRKSWKQGKTAKKQYLENRRKGFSMSEALNGLGF